jgi:predicted transposase YbfD/YdcC
VGGQTPIPICLLKEYKKGSFKFIDRKCKEIFIMQTIKNKSVENKFLLLSVEEKASIISHGVALHFFEEKYNLTIA